jgi:alkyldihydroxyacetonephosphate synthase
MQSSTAVSTTAGPSTGSPARATIVPPGSDLPETPEVVVRRWNGWGDAAIEVGLPPGGRAFLEREIGRSAPPRDATFEAALASVPAGRAPRHPLVDDDPEDRLRHARGQSFADWVAVRSGRLGWLPDGVAHPATDEDVRELLRWAAETGTALVPYGGGTSVAGHVTRAPGSGLTVTVALDRLAAVADVDPAGGLATFGAGIAGPALEAALQGHGTTLGHFPQSFEYSTLGGWVATRSSGQQSRGYGRIEDLFAGGHVETPLGPLDLPPFPASAAGPDLRQVVLGSEGRLGILTQATVRIAPLPEREVWPAFAMPDLEHGLAAARELAQARLPLSMIRLQTAPEARTTLALAGRPRTIALLTRYLRWRGAGPERCLLFLALTGRRRLVATAGREVAAIVARHGAIGLPGSFGHAWVSQRYRSAYLRNALWDAGYGVDTLETAAPWSAVPGLLATIASTLRHGLEGDGERVHAFSHLSHVYPSGSSIYTTYLFRLDDDPDRNLERWARLKSAASEAIVAGGGTISHQHGVGRDHAPYLATEKGPVGMSALQALVRTFDPNGVLNPGSLVDDERPTGDRSDRADGAAALVPGR